MNNPSKAVPVKKAEHISPTRAAEAPQVAQAPAVPQKPAPVLKPLPDRAPLPPKIHSNDEVQPAGLQATKPGAIKHGSPNGLSPVGYTRNTWEYNAARGVTVQDILVPEYWLHLATQLRPNDKIEVICEDGSWEALVRVVNCDRTWAKVYVLMYHDLTQARSNSPARAEDEYDVDWTVGGKWTITKKSQKGQPPVKDGFLSRLEAYTWLDGHIKSIT